MRARLKPAHVEWGLVVLLAGFCAVLSVLQYRWTGELSRAEAERMRSGINEQAQEFCRAFDSTLTRSCEALVPTDESLNDDNREEIHAQHFQKWKSGNPRPIFSRLAVAVSTQFGTQLFEQDQTTGKLALMPWPSDWNSLQMLFSRRPMGGAPPFENPQGMLFALPVFSGRSWSNGPPDRVGAFGGPGSPGERGPPFGRGRPLEMEWDIFELDTNYLRNTWLPELTRRYLNPGAHAFNDVVIKTVSVPRTIVFSSPVQSTNTFESPVTVAFNRQGRSPDMRRGPGTDFCWELQVRPHLGAVDAIVEASRRRNLTVALLLNGLIFAAGFALLVHTRRSRELSRAQMAFVANVSHEIRTPLTVIRGAGHNLLRGVAREPGQIEQYSRLIIQHAEQLTGMVEQILELAGVRKNASAALRAPVAVSELLQEAVAATKQDTEATHCEVHLELPPGLPPVIGDAPALRRVFQNLITNAAKHGGQGGWIGISAANVKAGNAPMVEIKVADRGPGIPKAELPEIFKPFFRGANAQARQIRGSGLGLSLVREIIEAHGGAVSVESQSGQGAVFVVRLPASDAAT